MGQYWKAVNLDKREFIMPHKLGSGLKLWEQLANHPGVGAALIILCAAMPEHRGGGDLDLDANWHGPERTFPEHNIKPGPMPEGYQAIAHRTIGRWAGDRIALVGDYTEKGDLPAEHNADLIYGLCCSKEDAAERIKDAAGDGDIRTAVNVTALGPFTDITDDVAKVIEHELNGKFKGDGWKQWTENVSTSEQPVDMSRVEAQTKRKRKA